MVGPAGLVCPQAVLSCPCIWFRKQLPRLLGTCVRRPWHEQDSAPGLRLHPCPPPTHRQAVWGLHVAAGETPGKLVRGGSSGDRARLPKLLRWLQGHIALTRLPCCFPGTPGPGGSLCLRAPLTLTRGCQCPPLSRPAVLSAMSAHGRPSPSPLGLFFARHHISLLEGQLCEGRTSVCLFAAAPEPRREPDTQEAQRIRNVCHL